MPKDNLMKRHLLFSFAAFVFLVLIGALMTQSAQAATYYWRWTDADGYECGAEGVGADIYVGFPVYEYNLPASGAVISQYEINNGVSSYKGDITGLSGSGSGSETIDTDVSGTNPLTYSFQRDTMVNGLLVYRSTLTYTCGTVGRVLTWNATITNQSFGSGVCPDIPGGSVVGAMPAQTQAFYEPGNISPNIFINPGTYWVIGEDDSGQYYKIMLACQFLWVPIDSMQSSYQAPWSGQPLPTRVVQ
jgi:hypothetical protein